MGQVVERIAGKADARARAILSLLDGLSGQEAADAILLAMVLHIEASVSDSLQSQAAAGVASALMSNFEE